MVVREAAVDQVRAGQARAQAREIAQRLRGARLATRRELVHELEPGGADRRGVVALKGPRQLGPRGVEGTGIQRATAEAEASLE